MVAQAPGSSSYLSGQFSGILTLLLTTREREMDVLTRSPAKILKEKCSRGFELLSPVRSRELLLLQERKFAALNLSIRRKYI